MTWKRIAALIAFILLIVGLGYLLYLIFFSPTPKASPPISEVEEPPIVSLPTSGDYIPSPDTRVSSQPPAVITKELIPETASQAKGGAVQIREVQKNSNINPHLAGDGKSILTFDEFAGTFYRVTPDGALNKLSEQEFIGAQSVVWSPQADKAALTFPDGSNIIYNFKQNSQVTIPAHWREIDFSPSGNQLTFKSLGEDPDNRWLAVANADGSSVRALEPLGAKAGLFIPSWSPSGQVAALFHEGIDYNRQKVFFIGLNGENFKALVVSGRGFENEWSPIGDRLLYSIYSQSSNFKPELWIVDAIGDSIGENRKRLRLNTWAHKCSFANNETIYCAVPRNLRDGAGLIPALGDTEQDDLYRINLATGMTSKLAELPEKHTIEALVVTKDESTLFFTDKATGKLYTIKL